MERGSAKTPFLSTVIPAYNEERRIRPTLGRIREYLDKQAYTSEVIVVDDGSIDGTARVVAEFQASWPALRLIRTGRNRGKGYSVKTGFSNAEGEILLFSDADLSTPIEEADKLIAAIRSGAAVSIGSRALDRSVVRIHQPWYRELMGKIFNRFVRLIAVQGIHDTQCGFKAFTREAAMNLISRQRIDGFSFDVEILYIARRLGYVIREIPVTWINNDNTRVRLIQDSLGMLIDLLRIPLIHRTRKPE